MMFSWYLKTSDKDFTNSQTFCTEFLGGPDISIVPSMLEKKILQAWQVPDKQNIH